MLLDEIVSVLKRAGTIAILPHVMADGDALGSSVALAMALDRLKKKVAVYLEEDVPHIYGFLEGLHLTGIYAGNPGYFDVAVALDAGDLERLGGRAEVFRNAGTTVNIDHHNTNSEFAFFNLVRTSSAAVGEIIYQMVKMMGLEIDRNMAECLYVAISTDTGGFRFSNTTALTHRIASDLINSGIDIAEISRRIFDTVPLRKVKLMGEAIKSLELFENGSIAVLTVTDDMMERSGAKEEDCDGIVNIGRNIECVEVAAMFREKKNGSIKVNLRSKCCVDVAEIAWLYKGGGHKRAAGCTVEGDIGEIKKQVLEDIRKALAETIPPSLNHLHRQDHKRWTEY